MSNISIESSISNAGYPALAQLCQSTGESIPHRAVNQKVESLLYAYKRKYGNLDFPINPWRLAELVDACVEVVPTGTGSEGQLLPIRGGFIIRVREQQAQQRANLTICHEIAHTFFYDRTSSVPKRPLGKQATKEEENLCFTAARQLLVPEHALRDYGRALLSLPRLDLVSKVANHFGVSLPVSAMRLTLDTSLVDDTIFTFWGTSARTEGVRVTLTDKEAHVAPIMKRKYSYMAAPVAEKIGAYWRRLIYRAAYDVVRDLLLTRIPKYTLIRVGTKKQSFFVCEARKWGTNWIITAIRQEPIGNRGT